MKSFSALQSGLSRCRVAAIGLAVLLQSFAAATHSEVAPKIYPPLPAGIGLASLPDWLLTYTDIQPLSVVSIAGRGVVLVVRDKGVAAGADQRTGVVIRREALSDDAVRIIGGRSELVRLDLDCVASQYRVLEREVYSGNALTGSVRTRQPDTSNFPVRPNTDVALLLHAICDPTYSALLSPYLAGGTGQLGGDATAPASKSQHSPGSGGFAVQIVAAQSQGLARTSLAEVARQIPSVAGMPTRVEAVHVGGKVAFRGLIAGFSTRALAEAFCAQLRSSGGSCWVR